MKKSKWYGDKGRGHKLAMQALHDGAEVILEKAINQAPVLSGTLRRSGTVTDAPQESRVYVSFNTPYAVRQHEELGYQHPGGGKAKYLEDPFNEMREKVLAYVKKKLHNGLGGR